LLHYRDAFLGCSSVSGISHGVALLFAGMPPLPFSSVRIYAVPIQKNLTWIKESASSVLAAQLIQIKRPDEVKLQ